MQVGDVVGKREVMAIVGAQWLLRCECGYESWVRKQYALRSKSCLACAGKGEPKREDVGGPQRIDPDMPWELDSDAHEWVRLRPEGADNHEVGRALGLSGERVRQILRVAKRKVERRGGRLESLMGDLPDEQAPGIRGALGGVM